MPSLALACRLSAVSRASRRPFSPASLFSSGEQGVWYDPSDFSTLFQDAAGTIPVTAVEQPVGKMLDKSGRGNHATQATTASRPTLQQESGKYYLLFDGVDDWLVTPSIDFTATDKMTVFAGVRKLSNTSQLIAGVADVDNYPGTFSLFADQVGTNVVKWYSSGSLNPNVSSVTSPSVFAPPYTLISTGIGDISGDKNELRVNGVSRGTNTLDQGTGNFGQYPLYIGSTLGTVRRFNGRLYGLIVRGAATDDNHLTHAEKYLAYKSGVSL